MVNMVRWDPFRGVSLLQNRMNRLFDDALDGWSDSNGKTMTSAWSPPADIFETDSELIVSMDLPGVDSKQIDLRVENNVLMIQGERQVVPKVQNENVHRVERTYGTFMRSFTLSTTVDADKIRASYKDGVLSITLPKAEQAKPKKIQISAVSG